MYFFEVYNSDLLLADLLSIKSSTPTHHKTANADDVNVIITTAERGGSAGNAVYQ